MIDRLFLRHPRAVGESYREHAAVAARIGLLMIAGGLACLVHAVLPGLFTSTGSGIIRRLHGGLGARRPRERAPASPALIYEI